MKPALPVGLFALLAAGWLLWLRHEQPLDPAARKHEPTPAVAHRPHRNHRDMLLEEAGRFSPADAGRVGREVASGTADPRRRAALMARH